MFRCLLRIVEIITTAADGGTVGGDDNIFVYLGGEQEVPADVTRVIIDRSVKIIPREAFNFHQHLVSVEFVHDEVEKIERRAFYGCFSLRGIKLSGVKEVEDAAFYNCSALTDVEFSDKLDIVGEDAFNSTSLRKIKMPSVRIIEGTAFGYCEQLTDVELPGVDSIGNGAFNGCVNLQRIAIPLKENMFAFDTGYQRYTQFDGCENLTTVDLVGGIHKTISFLPFASWRNEMNREIDRINQLLPNTPSDAKTNTIMRWIASVINRMEHYKAEHNRILKEDMTQLELAVWKAKLDEIQGDALEGNAKIDMENVRKELRTTSGADVIIINVLRFLKL